MTDVITTFSYDKARARKQIWTVLVAGSLSALATIGSIVGAVVGGSWSALFIFLAVVFGISALIFLPLVKVVAFSARQTRGALTTRGIVPPAFEQPIPWEIITGLTVIRYNNSALATKSVGSVAVAGALAAGGINDGERTINIVVRDAADVRALLPAKLDYLVSDRLPMDDEPGVSLLLGQVMGAEQFQQFVDLLEIEANKHNITVRYW